MISVIIPFFNSEFTIERSIDSVISQFCDTVELILINDGSLDGSVRLVKPFLNDPQIKLFNQNNFGVSSARNLGASEAKGRWLIFLDSDDQLRDGFFSKLIEELQGSSEIDYLVFGINRIKGDQIQSILPRDGYYFSKIPGTFVIRKSVFDQVGGYDSRFRFAENTELFHRLELLQARGKNISWVSLNYYDNPTGGSKNLKNMVNSLTLFLHMHNTTLTPHVKFLYNQIIGVNLLRFGEFSGARSFFWKALTYKPLFFRTWLRFFISFIPFVSKRIYPLVQ